MGLYLHHKLHWPPRDERIFFKKIQNQMRLNIPPTKEAQIDFFFFSFRIFIKMDTKFQFHYDIRDQ